MKSTAHTKDTNRQNLLRQRNSDNTESPFVRMNRFRQQQSSSSSSSSVASEQTTDEGYIGYYSDHSDSNKDTQSVSSGDIQNLHSDSKKASDYQSNNAKEFLKSFDDNYQTIIQYIKNHSKIIDIKDIEQTTDDDNFKKKLNYENSIIFGSQPSDNKILYKQYLKGANKGKKYDGICLEILDCAKTRRNEWTPTQNAQRHYHGKTAPYGTKWHLSHALPNFFHGPETSANVAPATDSVIKGIIAQGNAQGYVEVALNDFLKKIRREKKSIDIRAKITDYYTYDNMFDTRRIKIFGHDDIGSKNKDKKNIYTEVLLGEFYLKSDLKWKKSDSEHTFFMYKIKQFKNALNDYAAIIDDRTRHKSNKQYWDAKGFIAREHIIIKKTHRIDQNIIPNKINDSLKNKQMSIQQLKDGKEKNTNLALYPMIVFLKNQSQEPNQAISQILKNKYLGLSQALQENIQNKFNEILELTDTTPVDKQKILKTKADLMHKENIFLKLRDFHFFLVENKIITVNDMRQFYANEIANTHAYDSVLAFKDTESSEYIISTLRATDKSKIKEE